MSYADKLAPLMTNRPKPSKVRGPITRPPPPPPKKKG